MKKKFKIEMCRIAYTFKTFEVEANNEKEAIVLTKKIAHNTNPIEFETKGISYSIENIETEN